MHTVIILSRHASELLKDYRFLFRPFIKDGTVSLCDWNESGTDVTASVPDLYKLIKGRQKWRAVIVDTEPAFGRKDGLVPDAKNPFDYPGEVQDSQVPGPSRIPLVRLTHMLCGYPVSSVQNFEDGYEYTDEDTGKTMRVRVSELSENEVYELASKYRERLSPIFLPEKVSEETRRATKALEEKYSFLDVRPQETFLVSTRRHPDDDEQIYASWKAPFEMESSDFCRRNHYPGSCRFLCCELTNPENSLYMKELMKFWLSVLTLAVNPIPASSLQAYKLYSLRVELSMEALSELLNDHLNKMEAAYAFVQKRLKMKPEQSFEESEKVVKQQRVPVMFEEISGADLLIDTGHVGLSRGCPGDELVYWNTQVGEKQKTMEMFLKAPRRAVDKAAQQLKSQADSFFDDEYELDRFQLADLKEELNILELKVFTSDTHSVIDEQRIRKELGKADVQVKKAIDGRMRKGVAVSAGLLFLLFYFIGYCPYLFHSMRLGRSEFFSALGLTAAALVAASIGGVAALFLMKRQLVQIMERFNGLMRELARNVNGSAKKFEQYFSTLATFMKAQSIYVGAAGRRGRTAVRISGLRTHKQALALSIERDEEIAAVFGIKRTADFEKNVTRFFDEDRPPQENPLYYYAVDSDKTEIPLNTAGDLIQAPYRFIAGLKIERLDLYENKKEGSRWRS